MRGSLADRMRGAGKEQDHKYQKKKKKSDFLRLFYHQSAGWAEKKRLGVRRPSENLGQ